MCDSLVNKELQYILLNFSQIKDNQTIKFGHSQNIPREIFFFKNYAENEAGELVPDQFLFFKNILHIFGKSKWSAA